MKDVIIVGGGLKGMLTALFLYDAGLNVMILDQRELGRESSWAGGGLTAPLYPWQCTPEVNTLVRYSQSHYPKLCQTLHAHTTIDPQWQYSGSLLLDTDQHEMAIQWANKHQQSFQASNHTSELQTQETQLNSSFAQGLYFPRTSQIRTPRLAASLKASLRQRFIVVSEHQPVQAIHIEKGQAAGVYLGDTLLPARQVVLTAGAWTNHLAKVGDLQLSIKPVMAQSIMFRTQRDFLKHIIVHNGYYLIPRQDGRLVCGAVLQHSDFNKQLDATAQQTLSQFARQTLPALQDYPVHNHWGSLLAMSSDGIPYIGEHPAIRGLYINAGHGNMGTATGLASAQLVADLLLGQDSFTDLSPYRLDR